MAGASLMGKGCLVRLFKARLGSQQRHLVDEGEDAPSGGCGCELNRGSG